MFKKLRNPDHRDLNKSMALHLNLDLQLCTLEYCIVGQNETPDVALSLAWRDHRKSKFGLRHRIKLIQLYTVTKSEFWFSIARDWELARATSEIWIQSRLCTPFFSILLLPKVTKYTFLIQNGSILKWSYLPRKIDWNLFFPSKTRKSIAISLHFCSNHWCYALKSSKQWLSELRPGRMFENHCVFDSDLAIASCFL